MSSISLALSDKDNFIAYLTKKKIWGAFFIDNCEEVYYPSEDLVTSSLAALGCFYKKNILLYGPPGCGKTSFVRYLASLPKIGSYILSLSVSDILSGSEYRGSFEEKCSILLLELKKYNNIILFLDEAHMVLSTQSRDGIGMMDILKPHLLQSDIKVILATTYEGASCLSQDKAFLRRFSMFEMNYLGEKDKKYVLEMHVKRLKLFHKFEGDIDINQFNNERPLYEILFDIDLFMSRCIVQNQAKTFLQVERAL